MISIIMVGGSPSLQYWLQQSLATFIIEARCASHALTRVDPIRPIPTVVVATNASCEGACASECNVGRWAVFASVAATLP